MATRTHAWITTVAVALLSVATAGCAMPEPIPFADSGLKWGDAMPAGGDKLDGKDAGPLSHPDVEGALDSCVSSDGRDGCWGLDGMKPDGVKPDGLSQDGPKQDGLKDGLTLDGPKKKLDGQKKPDGKP